MKIPKWLTEFGSSFIAALVAHMVAHKDDKERPKSLSEAAAQGLAKILLPAREDLIKELDRLGRDGIAILRFLERVNVENDGIFVIPTPQGRVRRYAENDIVNMLLEVKTKKDLYWTLARLNRLCAQDPAVFVARLEVLHNDWHKQYPRIALASARDGARRLDNSLEPLARWFEDLAGLEHPTEEGGEV